ADAMADSHRPGCRGGRRGAVRAHQQQAGARSDDPVNQVERPAVQAEALDIGERPAEPGAGQREGRRSGQHQQLLRRQLLGEGHPDAEPHRVAGRQRHHRAAAPGEDLVDGARHRRRPGAPLGAALGHQRQVTPAADQQRRAVDQRPGLLRQAVEPALANADDGEPRVHRGSPSPARSALTAAAASALPPRLPRSVRKGIARPAAISASFDSAAPTKPTGKASNKAGRGAPAASRSSRWNKAVGALPMATTAPACASPHSSTAAAERVVPMRWANAGTAGSSSRQITLLPADRRRRWMPAATMEESQRMAAPRPSASRPASTTAPAKARSSAMSTMPQAWISRTATSANGLGKW